MLTFDGYELRTVAAKMFISGPNSSRPNLKTFHGMASETELPCFYTEIIEYKHFTK